MGESDLNVLRSGLDLMILKALSAEPRHGYGVAEWIQRATDDLLYLEEGTLYPALHRLEAKGWLTSSWGISESNRRARFYKITPKGRSQLRNESASWSEYVGAIGRALGLA